MNTRCKFCPFLEDLEVGGENSVMLLPSTGEGVVGDNVSGTDVTGAPLGAVSLTFFSEGALVGSSDILVTGDFETGFDPPIFQEGGYAPILHTGAPETGALVCFEVGSLLSSETGALVRFEVGSLLSSETGTLVRFEVGSLVGAISGGWTGEAGALGVIGDTGNAGLETGKAGDTGAIGGGASPTNGPIRTMPSSLTTSAIER
jgi:hypothetical protein